MEPVLLVQSDEQKEEIKKTESELLDLDQKIKERKITVENEGPQIKKIQIGKSFLRLNSKQRAKNSPSKKIIQFSPAVRFQKMTPIQLKQKLIFLKLAH